MDKNSLKKQLLSKKTKDYTYGIIFFLTFSFFVFFVIRPNLVNVFSLQEELGRLKILDAGYENVIRKIVDIQTFLETNRSDLYLLDQAVSSSPQINKVIADIEAAASSSGVIVHQVDVNKIDLKHKDLRTSKNTLVVNMATRSDFDKLNAFIGNLLVQRRLKTLKSVSIERMSNMASGSAELDVKIELDGFYL